jgi:hypothetical protein
VARRRATSGDEVFRQLVLARIIEPVSKLDSLRVLEEAGAAPASHATLKWCTGISGEPPALTRTRDPRVRPGNSAWGGAGERDRTADLPFTRRLLCQLSYTGG